MSSAVFADTSPQPRWMNGIRVVRLVVALAVLGVAVAVLAFELQTREFEAYLAGRLFADVIPGDVRVLKDMLVIAPVDRDWDVGLRITQQCAGYVLMLPLLVFLAGMIGFTRVSPLRWLLGAAIGIIGIVAVNQLRILVIAYASVNWGMANGYRLTHDLVASILGVLGFVAILGITLVVMTFRKKSKKQRHRSRHQA